MRPPREPRGEDGTSAERAASIRAAEDRASDARAATMAAGPEEPPPILGSWRNVYLLVLGELAVLVVLFHALRRWAS